MSRYIRTKDGRIIKISKEGVDEFGKYGMVDEENCIRNYDNLKQADTIEELCDEFVVIIKNKPHLMPREWLKQGIKVDVLYGAVWTDIGLMYVAKMNEKGELELL